MIAEVIKYKEISKSIPEEINKSPLKMEYIIKESGISPATFYRKLKSNAFSPDEIIRILIIIKPEEAHMYQFQMLLKQSLQEVEEGNTIDHEEMKKHIAEKYEAYI